VGGGGEPNGPTADLALRLGRGLGSKYEVRRLVGEGGFAQVWEVWDTELQRRLAVKVLKPDLAWSAGMLERFKQECRSVARLEHPNILPIHFVGESEGLVFYAMPFVEGESLATLLRRQGPLVPDRALAILRPILEALSHAHAQGLVHRDIKPDNIMLQASSGRPLLVDFGIAKRVDGGGHRTQTGFVVGTPQYMSPEQALGQGDLDARSDIYAIGAVLFQMLTGVPPFEGDTSQEIVGKHLSEPAPLATARNARIPMWLSEVIVRCLAKRPAERFQSVAALESALEAGRQSGSQEGVSAERVAKRLQEERTVALESAERATLAAAPAAPVKAPPPRPAVPAATAPPWLRRWPVAAAVLVAGAGATWVLAGRARPVLVVENQLLEPIRVVVGASTREVPAGGRLRAKLRRPQPPVAHWYVVRPSGPAGNALGVDVQGAIPLDSTAGGTTFVVTADRGDRPVFAPLVTNTSGAPLSITVNAGLAGALDCGCSIAPGAVRARLGYYPLFKNSTVQAQLPTGERATFTDLGTQVDRRNGAVGLRFSARDFKAR
jgi:hypothetical protein